jgi:Flp pilus assembly protein TadD
MMMNTRSSNLNQEIILSSSTSNIEKKIIENGESNALIRELADGHFQESNFLRALSCYIKLLSLEPNNPRVWNKLAITFIKLEEFNTAIEMSRIAHKLINIEMEH